MADELMQEGISEYNSFNQGEVVGQNLVQNSLVPMPMNAPCFTLEYFLNLGIG